MLIFKYSKYRNKLAIYLKRLDVIPFRPTIKADYHPSIGNCFVLIFYDNANQIKQNESEIVK